ncbi:MAG: phosphoribosylaminoimidazolesuccinocarboxamide synthase [Thiotrichales bacterium]
MAELPFACAIHSLPLLHRGKVRDIYAVDGQHLLIVASDRLSAFDVILPTPIPGKGEILTRISNFWFERCRSIIPNHLTGIALETVLPDPAERAGLAQRSVVVKRLKPLPIEAIVRGYLIGSGWKDYQRAGEICGLPLPPGLRLADRLPEAMFTPSTKAAVGDHDVNIDYAETCVLIGPALAQQVRDTSLEIYRQAASYALQRGIIIADTKFEFGLDDAGILHLIDEVLTPDSSRFWPTESYQPGLSPPSFDKQYVRDYLESLAWNKQPPAPDLPDAVARHTALKYLEAFQRLTGESV